MEASGIHGVVKDLELVIVMRFATLLYLVACGEMGASVPGVLCYVLSISFTSDTPLLSNGHTSLLFDLLSNSHCALPQSINVFQSRFVWRGVGLL